MNNVNFTYLLNQDGTFKINFNPISRPLLDWKSELIQTAKNIRALTDKPLFLCLSGGIDGEVAARSFIKAGIEFTALTLRHNAGTNEHDIVYAREFCKAYNIPHKIVDFDISFFIRNNIPFYIEQGYRSWRTFRFQQIYLFELAESLGGTTVLGGGEQTYITKNNEICINFKSDFFMCVEWLKNNKKLHFPFFHMQNSELYASYLNDKLIQYMHKDPSYFVNVWGNDTSYDKMFVYHKNWPEMKRRKKFNGFENLKTADFTINYVHPRRKELGDPVSQYIPVSLIREQLGI